MAFFLGYHNNLPAISRMSLTAASGGLKFRPSQGKGALSGCSSAVEHFVANEDVVSSILITRSNFARPPSGRPSSFYPN